MVIKVVRFIKLAKALNFAQEPDYEDLIETLECTKAIAIASRKPEFII